MFCTLHGKFSLLLLRGGTSVPISCNPCAPAKIRDWACYCLTVRPATSICKRWNHAPRGLIACALLFWALGVYLLVAALLVAAGAVAFTIGAWLLGGMETMGATIYVIVALIAILIGAGLLLMKSWARHLASVAAGVVFVLTIPTISSAVAYSQTASIVREGLKIIVCVVLFRYLNVRETAEAFADSNQPRSDQPQTKG
jgi:hypothetical protein